MDQMPAGAATAPGVTPTDRVLHLGDCIALYSPEAGGFLYNKQSSSLNNTLVIAKTPDVSKPLLPNPHVAVFEICIANRYKLEKAFRKLQEQAKKEPDNVALKAKLFEAEQAASEEREGNLAEQQRLMGKPLKYGVVVQLRHLFTNSFVHTSTNQTSKTSASDMMVELLPQNLKTAQFKIMPRYKVKSEGDIVLADDLLVFESIKSPGQYIRVGVSPISHPMSPQDGKLEITLSVRQSGLKTVRFTNAETKKSVLTGGSAIRLFHKEMEAYLVSEGLFDWETTQQPHLRIREMDISKPKTLTPSKNSLTFWQIELEEGPLVGEPIKWESQVRLRHMATRKYLGVAEDGETLALVDDLKDPNTVFRITAVMESDIYVEKESYARFEHVVSGHWLHAMTEKFVKTTRDKGSGLAELAWDKSVNKKVGLIDSMQYDDAFTLQTVSEEVLNVFNFMTGCVPVIQSFLQNRKEGVLLDRKSFSQIVSILKGLQDAMYQNGIPVNYRQMQLRNLMIVELLLEVLKLLTEKQGAPDEVYLGQLALVCYQVLSTYLHGDSRTNELYVARHLPFLLDQINKPGEVGLAATKLCTELIKDNRKITDSMKKKHIDAFIKRLQQKRHYQYLDLLKVLCVCNEVALPENQTYITKKLLIDNRELCIQTESGARLSKISGQKCDKSMTYVSPDNGANWSTLVNFTAQKSNTDLAEYLLHQLQLFEALAWGRNSYVNEILTKREELLTWDEVFMCLTDHRLPPSIRAQYGSLIIVLFLDVGDNFSVLDRVKLTFEYERVGSNISEDHMSRSGADDPLRGHLNSVQQWLLKFLRGHCHLAASQTDQNLLLKQVLRLTWYLIAFGFYSNDHAEVQNIAMAIVQVLDGTDDLPYPQAQLGKLSEEDREKMVTKYQQTDRFKAGDQTAAMIEAKLIGMEVLDIIFNLRFNNRMEALLLVFKRLYLQTKGIKGGAYKELVPLLATDFDIDTYPEANSNARKVLEKLIADTAMMSDGGAYMKSILLDLSNYDDTETISQSMYLLLRYFSAHELLFERAISTQVVLTDASVQVYRYTQEKLPQLRQLSASKLTEKQVRNAVDILETLSGFCMIDPDTEEPHFMNQNIIYNQRVIADIIDIFNSKKDVVTMPGYDGVREVFGRSLTLIKRLARGNETVQMRIYDRIFEFLDVKGSPAALADALTEVFRNNKNNCLKCPKEFIRRVISLLAASEIKEPKFFVLLQAVVKIDVINLPIRGNQNAVIKNFMERRTEITKELGSPNLLKRIASGTDLKEREFFTSIIDLLATCAEGENKYIASVCQSIFSVDDLLEVLTMKNAPPSLRKCALRFFLWVYVNTGDEALAEISEDMRMTAFLSILLADIEKLLSTFKSDRNISKYVKTAPKVGGIPGDPHWTTFFLFEAAFPFLEVFFREVYDREKAARTTDQTSTVNKLASVLVLFTKTVWPHVSAATRVKTLSNCTAAVLSKSNVGSSTIKAFRSEFNPQTCSSGKLSIAMKGYKEEFGGEEELNDMFNRFAISLKKCYGGRNDVKTQIDVIVDREYAEVINEEADTDLPLGAEFQVLIGCFKDEYPSKLIETLWLQDHKKFSNDRKRLESSWLSTKALTILRGIIHNAERTLPENWILNQSKHREKLERISELQVKIESFGAIEKLMPLVASKNDQLVLETLRFFAALFFNGNKKIQQSFLDFIYGTREETFFYAIKRRIENAAASTKERKALMNQYQAKLKDTIAMMKQLAKQKGADGQSKTSLRGSRVSLQQQLKEARGSQIALKETAMGNGVGPDKKVQESAAGEEDGGVDTVILEMLSGDSGDDEIQLMFKVLGLMCDGQNSEIQDYLREQQDNMKSFNLVAEVSLFLQILYTNVNSVNIGRVTETVSTLLELCSGNFANQIVCFENKVVMCVNLMMRQTELYNGCTIGEMYELKQTLADLLMALLEEDSPANRDNVSEVRDSIEYSTIFNNMVLCYRLVHDRESLDLEKLGIDDEDEVKEEEELIEEVGHKLFHIISRMHDIRGPPLPDKSAMDDANGGYDCRKAWNEFDSHCLSIEILKDNELQKRYFRVVNMDVLREDVKEMVKWGVDRSSPSNKVRDFVAWSRSIIDDIRYQSKMMKKPGVGFLLSHSNLWHNAFLFITLLLNIVVLFAWHGPNDPKAFFPEVDLWFWIVLYPLGAIHLILSLILLVEYFISNRPAFPSFGDIKDSIVGVFCSSPEEEDEDAGPEEENHLQVDFFSVKTLYYFMILGFSALGLGFTGYFYCLHLLHVVPRNQLLSRVLQSVTQNGSSLLLVGVLGVIIIWIYAVAGFAFLRVEFTGEDGLYCKDMIQCFVTHLRFGIIDGLQANIGITDNNGSFGQYTWRMLYDVSFFIIFVTILMNIIFGIIVDTFSELRDLKWQAEEDMTSSCFICSRSSYNFEHHGKGFEHHVRKEHSMWAYLFYFIYLSETRSNDYTAIDLYVSRLLEKDNYEFFPLNRALCLADEGGEEDNKLDRIIELIEKITTRQDFADIMEMKQQQYKKIQKFKGQHKGQYKYSVGSSQQPVFDDR